MNNLNNNLRQKILIIKRKIKKSNKMNNILIRLMKNKIFNILAKIHNKTQNNNKLKKFKNKINMKVKNKVKNKINKKIKQKFIIMINKNIFLLKIHLNKNYLIKLKYIMLKIYQSNVLK